MPKYLASARADGFPIIGDFFACASNSETIRIVPGNISHRVIKSFGREITVPEKLVRYELRDAGGKWVGGLEYNAGKLVLSDLLCERHVDLLKALCDAISAKIVDEAPSW